MGSASLAMKHRVVLSLCAAGIALACAGGAAPLVLHNGSPSVPVGFYVRSSGPPVRDAFVTVRASLVAPDYARARHFDDDSDHFIKRVAAGAGELVCAHGERVAVGAITLRRLSRDSANRVLPAWSQCRRLRDGEVFLLGDTDDSFDSRYFGPVNITELDGVWRPLGRRGRHTGLAQRPTADLDS